MKGAGVRLALALVAGTAHLPGAAELGGLLQCANDLECHLNGVCRGGRCACDAPWVGNACETLALAPGKVGLHGIPLCAYHGDGPNATSWGGSVLHAPEDGLYYMWVASMVGGCPLNDWQTNSEVVLTVADAPLGPYTKLKTVVPSWAHNPEAIRAPEPASKTGHVYALYTLGDGRNYHGVAKSCDGSPPPPPSPVVPATPPFKAKGACSAGVTPHGPNWSGCTTANFTIFWSETAGGVYAEHTAQILDWPTHQTGRPWDYGAFGNWNPAPVVHPNGTVFLMTLTSSYGWKHGQAILRADTWKGPYRMVASDTFASWGGSTANAEDCFMWVDRRGHFHALFEGYPMPGAHAYSADGLAWSNISMQNSGPMVGCFNLTRPYTAGNGTTVNASYYTPRPKLLMGDDGVTPTHLFNAAAAPGNQPCFTVASPLATQ